MNTIGFIGSGNMAEALIRGIIAAGVYAPQDIYLSDIRAERLQELAGRYGVVIRDTNRAVVEHAETVVLSVKPQVMMDALQSIRDMPTTGRLFISIAAGVKVAKIAAALGEVPIIRVMPNTPALVGEGASALFANEKAEALLPKALSIFSAVGKAVVVEEEGLIDAVTAVSGSGPAYFFLLMEAMVDAGIGLGLAPEVAKDLVLQTAKGAGLLAVEADKNGESPAVLRRKVTSPHGTTEAALKIFAGRGFPQLVAEALTAARDRSRELSA
ncbi:MAG: pyrroline-5-carboxylate reductase [Planctomycetes bacterium]|jgi:pyrroline-5-carboxylate reductase|nr:pyrroline-5-carboxylate reductase [Planctomycetota bacterium]